MFYEFYRMVKSGGLSKSEGEKIKLAAAMDTGDKKKEGEKENMKEELEEEREEKGREGLEVREMERAMKRLSLD